MMESMAPQPASVTTAVRRSNNRKGSPSEEIEQTNGTVLPLHHKNGKMYKKRRRTRRNKPVYCCGVPVDIPVVGVATILFAGVMLLVMLGSNSFHHRATAALGDAPGESFHHHFSHEDIERHIERHEMHSHRRRRQLDEFGGKEFSGEIYGGGNEEPQSGEAVVIPKSPVHKIDEKGKVNNIYDVVVAGAGPTGLTAALFASRAGLKVHVLGSPATGLLSQTKLLDNFPSFVGQGGATKSGPEWVETTKTQAISWGATFGPPGLLATSMERQRIAKHVAKDDDNTENDVFFALKTADNTEIRSWSVIVASGATPRTLGLSGEDKLWGVSLHNCAICDGHLYQASPEKPSTVMVVGGGDAALDGALLLARYASKVILVHRRDEFLSAHNPASLARVRSTPNIEMLVPYVVKKWITKDDDPSQIMGAELLSSENSLTGDSNGTRKTVDINGAFVMIGATPNTDWTKKVGIALDEEGLIRTTSNLPATKDPESSTSMIMASMATASSVPGLFAAGEVTDSIYKQAITAAAAGAQSAIDAERWLREQRGVSRAASATDGDRKHADASSTNRRKMDVADLSCDLVSEDCIRSVVEAHPVVVFSKTWCPYCRKALEALSLAGLPEGSENLLVIDLTKYSNTQEIQSTLQQITGRRTVPNVFIGGESIGGGDETNAAQRDGKLVPLLVKAGALRDQNDAASSSKAEKAEEWEKIQHDKTESRRKAAEEEKNKPSESGSSSDDTNPEICDLESEECFQRIVKKYPILLFSLSWCPECQRSLELLDQIGINKDQIHIIDLDDHEEIALTIRAHMKTMTGRPSVPNLFVGGEYIGGYHRTEQIHSQGNLVPKFQAVGALQ